MTLDCLAARYGLVVGRRNSRQITVLCIFHAEKTPSLVIWNDSQRWHCFGCQAGGTMAELLMKLQRRVGLSTCRDEHPDQLPLPFSPVQL